METVSSKFSFFFFFEYELIKNITQKRTIKCNIERLFWQAACASSHWIRVAFGIYI